jgi:hypothetical protein
VMDFLEDPRVLDFISFKSLCLCSHFSSSFVASYFDLTASFLAFSASYAFLAYSDFLLNSSLA